MEVLIDRAPDSAIRILLASQLREELGRDSPGRRYGVRLDWMLSACKAMVDTIDAGDRGLAPGRRWLEDSGQCFRDLGFAAGVGALAAAKYRSEEVSAWLDIMLRRRREGAISRYGWLERHASRQAEHAADIENLLVIAASDHDRREAIRGARTFDRRLWKFLNEMHRRQYDSVAA